MITTKAGSPSSASLRRKPPQLPAKVLLEEMMHLHNVPFIPVATMVSVVRSEEKEAARIKKEGIEREQREQEEAGLSSERRSRSNWQQKQPARPNPRLVNNPFQTVLLNAMRPGSGREQQQQQQQGVKTESIQLPSLPAAKFHPPPAPPLFKRPQPSPREGTNSTTKNNRESTRPYDAGEHLPKKILQTQDVVANGSSGNGDACYVCSPRTLALPEDVASLNSSARRRVAATTNTTSATISPRTLHGSGSSGVDKNTTATSALKGSRRSPRHGSVGVAAEWRIVSRSEEGTTIMMLELPPQQQQQHQRLQQQQQQQFRVSHTTKPWDSIPGLSSATAIDWAAAPQTAAKKDQSSSPGKGRGGDALATIATSDPCIEQNTRRKKTATAKKGIINIVPECTPHPLARFLADDEDDDDCS